MENNVDMPNNDYSVSKPLIISTIMGDVDIKEEPVILKRCHYKYSRSRECRTRHSFGCI